MAACFRLSNSTIIGDTSNIDAACSLITTANLDSPCCPIKDTGSLCLSDQLCWWKDIQTEGATGFVVASCTDSTYASSACNTHCTSNPVPDVIYNPDTGRWACCGWSYDFGTDCSNPTDETWVAPAPSVLLAAASAQSSIVSTSTSSSSSSTTSSSSSSITSSTTTTSTNNAAGTTGTSPVPASTASSSSSSGLSTGAKAGIGVGVSLGVLLLALAFFFVYRVGKKSRQPHNDASAPLARTHESNKGEWGGGNHGYKQGMSGERYMGYGPPGQAIEMHGNSASELPVTAPRDYSGRGGATEI